MKGSKVGLLTRVRWLSVIDAVTYVLLVGVAMPLKYLAGMPAAVSVVGMTHGFVWVLFMWSLARARFESDWPTSRLALLAVAALLPVVPFLLDGRVRAWIARS